MYLSLYRLFVLYNNTSKESLCIALYWYCQHNASQRPFHFCRDTQNILFVCLFWLWIHSFLLLSLFLKLHLSKTPLGCSPAKYGETWQPYTGGIQMELQIHGNKWLALICTNDPCWWGLSVVHTVLFFFIKKNNDFDTIRTDWQELATDRGNWKSRREVLLLHNPLEWLREFRNSGCIFTTFVCLCVCLL